MVARISNDDAAILDRVNARHTAINHLIDVAERVCAKLEHPTASVTIFDQTDLRAALDAVKN